MRAYSVTGRRGMREEEEVFVNERLLKSFATYPLLLIVIAIAHAARGSDYLNCSIIRSSRDSVVKRS